MDMGYIFSKVMRFYSMSYNDIQELPIYTFWELSRNIDRVSADESRLSFGALVNAIGVAFGGDPTKFSNALSRQTGRTIEHCDSSELDKSGLQTLKIMMGK